MEHSKITSSQTVSAISKKHEIMKQKHIETIKRIEPVIIENP